MMGQHLVSVRKPVAVGIRVIGVGAVDIHLGAVVKPVAIRVPCQDAQLHRCRVRVKEAVTDLIGERVRPGVTGVRHIDEPHIRVGYPNGRGRDSRCRGNAVPGLIQGAVGGQRCNNSRERVIVRVRAAKGYHNAGVRVEFKGKGAGRRGQIVLQRFRVHGIVNAVAIGIPVKGVGAAPHLVKRGQAVAVRVVVRVTDTVAIGIGIERVGADNGFLAIAQAVAVIVHPGRTHRDTHRARRQGLVYGVHLHLGQGKVVGGRVDDTDKTADKGAGNRDHAPVVVGGGFINHPCLVGVSVRQGGRGEIRLGKRGVRHKHHETVAALATVGSQVQFNALHADRLAEIRLPPGMEYGIGVVIVAVSVAVNRAGRPITVAAMRFGRYRCRRGDIDARLDHRFRADNKNRISKSGKQGRSSRDPERRVSGTAHCLAVHGKNRPRHYAVLTIAGDFRLNPKGVSLDHPAAVRRRGDGNGILTRGE